MFHPSKYRKMFPILIELDESCVFPHVFLYLTDVNGFETSSSSRIHRAIAKSKKKTGEHRWAGRADKQGYSHPWLLTSLKGHTGQVLDMDYSVNGKYVISCADG